MTTKLAFSHTGAMVDLLPRHAQALVNEALADTRVILVNGARQAGKSNPHPGGDGGSV